MDNYGVGMRPKCIELGCVRLVFGRDMHLRGGVIKLQDTVRVLDLFVVVVVFSLGKRPALVIFPIPRRPFPIHPLAQLSNASS